MDQEILQKVRATLAAALGRDPEEIRPEASLIRDLGAESIDFIDIIFRLEKTFDIKIPSGDLFPAQLLTDEQMVAQGKVTEAGLEELRKKLPYLDMDSFRRDPQVSKLGDFFTVQMILDYIRDRVAEKSSRSE